MVRLCYQNKIKRLLIILGLTLFSLALLGSVNKAKAAESVLNKKALYNFDYQDNFGSHSEGEEIGSQGVNPGDEIRWVIDYNNDSTNPIEDLTIIDRFDNRYMEPVGQIDAMGVSKITNSQDGNNTEIRFNYDYLVSGGKASIAKTSPFGQTEPATVKLELGLNNPKQAYYCDGKSHQVSWDKVSLNGMLDNITNVDLMVSNKDTNAVLVTMPNLKVVNGQFNYDISSLNYDQNQNLMVKLLVSGSSNQTLMATLSFKAVDSPQICVITKVKDECDIAMVKNGVSILNQPEIKSEKVIKVSQRSGMCHTDVELSKTVSKTNPKKGDLITYTIRVKNTGEYDADGLVVKDVLPEGVVYQEVLGMPEYNPETGLWTLVNPLKPGEEASIVITVKVVAEANTIITNSAEIVGLVECDIDSMVNNNDPEEDDQDQVDITVAPGSGGVLGESTTKPNPINSGSGKGGNVLGAETQNLASTGLNIILPITLGSLILLGLVLVSLRYAKNKA